MIDAEKAGGWTRYWDLVNNEGTHVGKPLMGPFVLESHSNKLNTWVANPYFFEVDPPWEPASLRGWLQGRKGREPRGGSLPRHGRRDRPVRNRIPDR